MTARVLARGALAALPGLCAVMAAAIHAQGAPAEVTEALPPGENLVAQDIPPIPRALAERASRYAEARAATLASWHPRRREMLVLTRFADVNQVHRVAMPGGARTQLTFFPDRVLDARYPPAPAETDHFIFSKDVGGGEFYQLYRYDHASAQVTLLTDGKSRNTLGAFSRDGRWLAYASTRRNGKDSDLWLQAPLQPGSERMLAAVEGGGWTPLDFSPDGRTLLVLEYVSIQDSALWLFDVHTGERRPLVARSVPPVSHAGGRFARDGREVYTTTDRDGEFRKLCRVETATGRHTCLLPELSWDVEDFALSPDGRVVAALANEDGRGVLHLLDARSGRRLPVPGALPGSVVGLAFHPTQPLLGLTVVGARFPADVFSVDLRGGRPGPLVRWTESEPGPVDARDFTEPELVRWRSFDGREISGYLYRPPGRFSGPRPVIVNIHGGPESQFRPGFLARNNYFVSELGVALLYPNVRGSSGYGKSFLALDNGRLREDAVRDVGALLDWLPTQPGLDARRVMVMGGSYGGYMSYAVSMHYGDRLRGAVAVVGISNFVTFLERTEAYRRDLRRVEYGDERDPQMRAFLHAISPAENVARIVRPLFIVQGANDPRVPLQESEQMVARLRRQGTPVWYLLARDEGHGFAKKRNADFQFYATVAFVERYLLAD